MASRAREVRGADKTQRVLEAVFRTLLRYHASAKVICYDSLLVITLEPMATHVTIVTVSNIGTSGSAPGSPGS